MNMNHDPAQMCPWVSILPHSEIKELKKESEVIPLIQLLVKVTLEAVTFYENGEYWQLDALVGNYGCEVHAFNILAFAHSEELKEECKTMPSLCQKITQCILTRKLLKNHEKCDLYQFYEELQGISIISQKMKYLVQSRLLTITKKVLYDAKKFDSREYEGFITVSNNLRKGIKLAVQDTVLNEIVSIAQSNMSLSSIHFMRVELDKLIIANGEEGSLVKMMTQPENLCTYTPAMTPLQAYGKAKKNKGTKTFSCCYYNTKAVLMLLAELKAPLIIKKMTKEGEAVQYFAFKPCGGLWQFEEMSHAEIDSYLPGAPVIVCVAYLPDQMSNEEWLIKVREYGLGNMIMANASQESQYIPKMPEVFPIPLAEAEVEINFQSNVKAQALECVRMKRSILDLDHFYCSCWQHLGSNRGRSNL